MSRLTSPRDKKELKKTCAHFISFKGAGKLIYRFQFKDTHRLSKLRHSNVLIKRCNISKFEIAWV